MCVCVCILSADFLVDSVHLVKPWLNVELPLPCKWFALPHLLLQMMMMVMMMMVILRIVMIKKSDDFDDIADHGVEEEVFFVVPEHDAKFQGSMTTSRQNWYADVMPDRRIPHIVVRPAHPEDHLLSTHSWWKSLGFRGLLGWGAGLWSLGFLVGGSEFRGFVGRCRGLGAEGLGFGGGGKNVIVGVLFIANSFLPLAEWAPKS